MDWIAVLTLALTGLGGIGIVVAWLLAGDADNKALEQARLGEAEFATLIASGNRVGDLRAPAVLLVYTDYRCGFCVDLHRTLEVLRMRYPQHLAVVYKHLVDTSTAAGRQYLVPLGSVCAGEQGAFEAYHAAAFANARVLDYVDGPGIIAEAAMIPDYPAFQECMDSRRHARSIRDQYNEARKRGVEVTPTMFLNGIPIVGSPPLESLDSLIVGQFSR